MSLHENVPKPALLPGSPGPVLPRQEARLSALQDSAEHFRQLYESTPAMLHSIDSQGRLLSVSDAWLAKLGYSREQVLGQPSVSFLTPASREKAISEVLPQFFAQGRCEDVEYQMVTRSGRVIDILMSAVLERDASGQPLRSVAVIQDVTERRRAERALLEERQRLAYIIEGTRAGTWEWNIHTGETRFNEQWAQIVGCTGIRLHGARLGRTWRLLTAGTLCRCVNPCRARKNNSRYRNEDRTHATTPGAFPAGTWQWLQFPPANLDDRESPGFPWTPVADRAPAPRKIASALR